jgi:uncharacterized protein (DUF305 family)
MLGILMPLCTLRAQTDGTCVPVAERRGREFGCFITARQELGRLPSQPALYWHLDTYATSAAAERARVPRSTVVESLGRIWMFTIAPFDWRPSPAGDRVARIGPLPLVAADSLAAVYMEGVFQPGMNTQVHRHPGTEAWYTLEGSMCLETPEGRMTQAAGDTGVLVRAGIPMMLTGTGSGPRRSVVLILQDATKPRSTPASDWTPRGLCGAATAGSAEVHHHDMGAMAAATIPRGALYTEADVRFMQGMIAHHAQAIYMSRMAEGHLANPRVVRFATKIDQSQIAEIRLMQDWLRRNGQTAPDTSSWRTMRMPGMLTAEQLARLDAARGAEFDRLFLTLMIQHHDGALAMVDDLFADSRNAQDVDVSVFANDVQTVQTAEIGVMRQMLGKL